MKNEKIEKEIGRKKALKRVIRYDNLDLSLIGITESGKAVYDFEKMTREIIVNKAIENGIDFHTLISGDLDDEFEESEDEILFEYRKLNESIGDNHPIILYKQLDGDNYYDISRESTDPFNEQFIWKNKFQ